MLLNEREGETSKFEEESLDFFSTRTVVVKNELYVFKEGCPVSAYKIAHFSSAEHLVKTTLPTLPRKEHLEDFAVSYVAGSIILTGGIDEKEVLSAQMYLMDLQTESWEQKSFPELNEARFKH